MFVERSTFLVLMTTRLLAKGILNLKIIFSLFEETSEKVKKSERLELRLGCLSYSN